MAHITGTEGDDTGSHALHGTVDDDFIEGLGGRDTLYGDGGNDILAGGDGVDVMRGGFGDDLYYVENSADVVREYGGQGNDSVISTVSYTLGDNVENLSLSTFDNVDATGNNLANHLYGYAGDNVLDGKGGADLMAGGVGNDTYYVDNGGDVVSEEGNAGLDSVFASVSFTLGSDIENLTLTGSGDIAATGNTLDNILTGNSGANAILAGAGNDILDGAAGGDSLSGGQGDDTYYVDDSHDTIVEGAQAGTDLIYSSVSYVLPDNVETLILTGLETLTATGNSGSNLLIGNRTDNILDGGGGDDLLEGGFGNDSYYLSNGPGASDIILEFSDGGTDTVFIANVNYSMAVNVENLNMQGSGNAFGNDLGNVITITGTGGGLVDGNDGNDTLTGASDGSNRLYGGRGNDVLTTGWILNGGQGNDVMTGGDGSTTYVVDSAGDVVHDTGTGGTDIVMSSVSYTLGAGLEDLLLAGTSTINATGNSEDNRLRGNVADNVVDGGAGNDTADYHTYEHGITVNLATGIATGGDCGNDTFISIENVTSGLSNDSLTGDGGVNILRAGAGNNILDGGAGADILSAGTGDDIFYVDNAGDQVHGGGGNDAVYASASYTLADKVRATLTLTGTGDLSATGNAYVNTLTGNGGDNRLDGAAGADVLTGGLGADEFYFTAAQLGHGERITDFSAADGDVIHIAAYDPAQHHGADPLVFQSGADVIVQIGSSHYIVVANTTYNADFLNHLVVTLGA